MLHSSVIAGFFCSLAIIASAPNAFAQSSDVASAPANKPLIPPEMVDRYAHAKWTYPAVEQLADFYPSKAQDNRVQGRAKIVCLIAADGYMEKCAVMSEDPKGYDFGVTTATVFVKFCHVDPATVEGGIKPGDYKVFIYNWMLG